MSVSVYGRGAAVPWMLAAVLGFGAFCAPAHAQGPTVGRVALTDRQVAGRVAHGLIVKLKEPPALEAAQSAAGAGVEHVRQARMQRVLREAGMSAMSGLGEVRQRPVGRSARHLDFGRVLQLDEAERLAVKLAARADVEWAVPNTRERRLAVPHDPLYAPAAPTTGQWWLYPFSNTVAEPRRGVPGFQVAWDTTKGLPSAVVAVLDTGIVASHPDFSGRVLPGYDFVYDSVYANDGDGRDSDAADPGDWVTQADITNDPGRFSTCSVENSSWHGTNTAGLIVAAADNFTGVAGINWNGRLLPVRVAGKCGADPGDIVDGMRWAAGLQTCRVYDAQGINCITPAPINPNPARIINISFGGTGLCEPYQDTIDELTALGVVIVAAAGNEQGAVTRPAKCPGVIGVGAVNRNGFKTNYSNFDTTLTISTVGGDPKTNSGSWGPALGDEGLLGIDIDGPTTASATTATDPRYAYLFGTSFSAPVVAGTVSLMLSVNPALTGAEIINGLKVTARPHVTSATMGTCSVQNYGRCICTTSTCGAGLLDAEQAVAYARMLAGNGVYTPPTRQAESIDSAVVVAAVAAGPDEPDNVSQPPNSTPGETGGSGGGGGGAFSPAWLFALAIAIVMIGRASRLQRRLRR